MTGPVATRRAMVRPASHGRQTERGMTTHTTTMARRIAGSAVAVMIVTGFFGDSQLAAQVPSSTATSDVAHETVIKRYCVACHNERMQTGGLALDITDISDVTGDPEVWEKVAQKLRTRTMPPAGRPRPDLATYDAVADYLERSLDDAWTTHPNPGRPALHRLNRSEYANAIRDLLALEVDGRSLLPADESGFGFDNIGDVLSMSPVLLERYILAAAKISRWAVGDPTLPAATALYKQSPLLLQDHRVSDDLPFGSRGGHAATHHFPLDAEYIIRVRLGPGRRGEHKLEIRLDRSRIELFDVAGRNRGPFEARLSVKAGTRLVGAAFVGDLGQALPVDGRPPRPSVTSFAYTLYPNMPTVGAIEIVGPFDGRVPEDTATRRRIFSCDPTSVADEQPCAEDILRRLARRAYRRPVADEDVRPLLASFAKGRDAGGHFDEGIRWALEAILVSPKFLFRVEQTPANIEPGTPYPVHDIDLASRLSFFLWSSIPDDELVDLAATGQLSDPQVLDQQIARMLEDPRSRAFIENFGGQWLYLRNLRTAAPDPGLFPDFDDNLREAFRRETELFFEDQLRDDHSVLDMLRADYTFVNERLASHYGMPQIYGNHFRRVAYADDRRAGLLGHGSLLTVTSYPHRTSPVVRGKWLLENLLGAPPPPPPPDVPGFPERGEGDKPATVRERLEQHRANPVCAACHAPMDPLGFALENFNAVGQWRTVDSEANAPIESSGVLPNGTAFANIAEFRNALLHEPWSGQYVANLVSKLLTYAVGRGVEYYDKPAVRTIIRDAEASDYSWSSIVAGVVRSAPFRMKMPLDPDRVSAQ